MGAGVYLLVADRDLVEMVEAPYDSEDLLQTLLEQHPSLLAATSKKGWPRRKADNGPLRRRPSGQAFHLQLG